MSVWAGPTAAAVAHLGSLGGWGGVGSQGLWYVLVMGAWCHVPTCHSILAWKLAYQGWVGATASSGKGEPVLSRI